MKVSEVMTRSVVTVRPDASFTEAVELLLTNDVSGLPVVDERGALIGIVTEADLISKEAFAPAPRRRRLLGLLRARPETAGAWSDKASGTTVAGVMTRRVVTVSEDENVHAAARSMLDNGIKRLPVVDAAGGLVGIVSRHDVLTVFARSDEELTAAVTAMLERTQFLPPWHDIRVTVRDGSVRLDGIVLYAGDVEVVRAVVGAMDGVVAVTGRLIYRERDPRPQAGLLATF